MKLRPYQTEAIEKIREAIRNGNRRVILQAATGSGKTIVAAEIAACAIAKGSTVLMLQNRRDLVRQTVDKFVEYGLGDHVGIIMAGELSHLDRQIQVASIQTYTRRIQLIDHNGVKSWLHDASLVIFDEAHSSIAPTYKSILDIYKKDAVILGLTATPCRSDGRGLGEMYQEIVPAVGIEQLIADGYLVPMVSYAPARPDLAKIKITAGDYNLKQLGGAMDRPKLVGDIYDNWQRLAGDRQTVIFAVNVKHSKHIRGVFDRRGVKIEHIDAKTDDETRSGIYSRFESGQTQVLTNVGICTEGSDFPAVSCIVIARPTKSYGRYVQMAGRGLRPFEGKTDCLLLDHSGCVEAHGFVDDEVMWTLDGKKTAWRRKARKKAEKKPIVCDECQCAFTGRRCPRCGWNVPDYGKRIAAIEADLKKKKGVNKPATMAEKRRWWAMLEYERRMRGYAPGWTAHKYREKFKVWPKGVDDVFPISPDMQVANWLKYQRIKWAKSQKRA